uniref:Uncharacterized protein n=1 Tax=Anguilla anguilla TaxID=7936 RepID=A0A0E9TPK7_ANGAN
MCPNIAAAAASLSREAAKNATL